MGHVKCCFFFFLNGTIILHYDFLVNEIWAKDFYCNRIDEKEEDSDDFCSENSEALTGLMQIAGK